MAQALNLAHDLRDGHDRSRLQVLDRREARPRRLRARSAARVADRDHAVVVLVGVDAGVVDADIGEEAAGDDRPHAQPAQQQVEIGGEEGAVAALANRPLSLERLELVHDLRAGRALEAVDRLVTVELAAEVHQLAAMDLLGEDHGQTG